jgi:hypothetical protein
LPSEHPPVLIAAHMDRPATRDYDLVPVVQHAECLEALAAQVLAVHGTKVAELLTVNPPARALIDNTDLARPQPPAQSCTGDVRSQIALSISAVLRLPLGRGTVFAMQNEV